MKSLHWIPQRDSDSFAAGSSANGIQLPPSPHDKVEPIYMSGATANRQMANKIAKGWEVDPPYKYPFQVSINGKAVKDGP